MEKDLLFTIAQDLKIRQFSNESDISFANRVIYSAMACWIKTCTQDNIIDNSLGVSRKHILERCTEILTAFTERYNYINTYFTDSTDADFNPIGELRKRLFQNGDIVNVGFDTNIGLAETNIIQISDDVSQAVGCLNAGYDFYSGVSTMTHNKNGEMYNYFDSIKWFNDYVKNAGWFINNKLEGYEYFNPSKKNSTNYKCWEELRISYELNVSLIRKKNVITSAYEYFLLKIQNGIAYIHTLDMDYYSQSFEYRRFQFVLRKLANNSQNATIHYYKNEYALLEFYAYLPLKESSFFESFAWPLNNINNKTKWILLPELWHSSKKILEDLGIKLEEKYDG